MAVLFPRPPPTYNTLSASQRAQLLRSNAKLGQVLGSTPHILDDTYSLPRLPAIPASTAPCAAARRSKERRSSESTEGQRGSFDSLSSSHASSSTACSSEDSQTTPLIHATHSEKSWRTPFPTKRPPILRVAKAGGSLESIPGSPPSDHQASFSDESPPTTPNFSIPTNAALRRQKMKRLTKKLGEGVPVHLVFPPTTESDDEEVIVESPKTESDCSWTSRDPLWEKHTARRSRFVKTPTAATVVPGKYVVHYEGSGLHGQASETFSALRCRRIPTIPEE